MKTLGGVVSIVLSLISLDCGGSSSVNNLWLKFDDAAAGSLPRGLRANTHAHFRRFAASSARLTLRVLRGQVTHARSGLTICGERLTNSARSLLHRRRERFAGLEQRLKASRLANAQSQRAAIARDRERAHRLGERAHRALGTLLQRLDARIAHSGKLLTALSYRSVLDRGFALVRDQVGHPYRRRNLQRAS